MEKRGVYRKGRAGHARNINPYILARQRFRKWRTPMTAFLALLFVFGAAPIVGENYQASLLTTDETRAVLAEQPEHARKVLLSALSDFLKDCERFMMEDCSARGSALVSDLANASPEQLIQVYVVLEDFQAEFEPEIARNACKYDLGKLSAESSFATRNIHEFFARYGEALGEEEPDAAGAAAYMEALETIVSSCQDR